MAAPYDIYPAVDSSYNFPPVIRQALVQSTDVQAALATERATTNDKFIAERQTTNDRFTAERALTSTALSAYSTTAQMYAADLHGNYRVASLSELFTLMDTASTRPPVGSIIHVGYSTTSGASSTDMHYGSVWRVTPGGQTAEPLPGSPILVDGNGSMNTIRNLCVSGGAWNSRMTLDHAVSSLMQGTVDRRRLEFRWCATGHSSGTPQWRLWPSVMTYSEIQYTGSTDYPLNSNAFTVFTFDNIPYDGLFTDYQGTSSGSPRQSFKLNYEGRYEIGLRWAPTNNDSNGYLSTVYNETRGGDEFSSHMGSVIADWPVRYQHERWAYAGDTIRAAVYKIGTNANWVRRGDGSSNANFASNRLQMFVKYIGWF